jgi:hypothetical protein
MLGAGTLKVIRLKIYSVLCNNETYTVQIYENKKKAITQFRIITLIRFASQYHAFYSIGSKNHTVAFCLPQMTSHAPCRFFLPTVEFSPVPPSQSLGVLCFPLSPPSRKGATQDPEIRLASQLASKAELPLQHS